VEKVIEVIVNNRNREPEMEKIKSPRDINENETVWIKVGATDPDNDELMMWVEEMPEDASFDDQWFTWTPSYDVVEEKKSGFWHDWVAQFSFLNRKLSQEKKVFTPAFVVSDDDFVINQFVDIFVRNINRAPEIVSATPETIDTRVGDAVVFEVEAVDLDGDQLSYEWDFGLLRSKVEGAEAVKRTFTVPGQKEIKLKISDGRDSVEKIWMVNVGEGVVEEMPQPEFTTFVVEG